eukprot:GFYU01015579.1.p1 GENE.GFYU01015579.1~~GFYU01015579.1.p1  ORF type:complete len:675 (-),score=108.72 GFYU01015579.1:501-2525(-)
MTSSEEEQDAAIGAGTGAAQPGGRRKKEPEAKKIKRTPEEEVERLQEELKYAEENLREKDENLVLLSERLTLAVDELKALHDGKRDLDAGAEKVDDAGKGKKKGKGAGKGVGGGLTLAQADDLKFIAETIRATKGKGKGGAARKGESAVDVKYRKDVCPFRITSAYTFDNLKDDACRYWDVPKVDGFLTDADGNLWPAEGLVLAELQRTSADTIYLIRRRGGIESERKKKKTKDGMEIIEETKAADGDKHADGEGGSVKESVQEMEDIEREVYTRVKKRRWIRFGIYAVYFGTALTTIFLRRSFEDNFNMRNAHETVFVDPKFQSGGRNIDFNEIDQWQDIWNWMDQVLLPGFYPENSSQSPNYNSIPNIGNTMSYYNRLVGKLRFRQVRVASSSCSIKSEFDDVVEVATTCYPQWSTETQSTSPYGQSGQTYTYSTADDPETTWGSYAVYDAGGYITDVDIKGSTLIQAQTTIGNLKAGRWLDLSTRSILILFSTFNANLEQVTSVSMLIEFTPFGRVSTSYKIISMRVHQMSSARDFAMFAVTVIQGIFVVYYIFDIMKALFCIPVTNDEEIPEDELDDAELEARLERKFDHEDYLPFWQFIDLSILFVSVLSSVSLSSVWTSAWRMCLNMLRHCRVGCVCFVKHLTDGGAPLIPFFRRFSSWPTLSVWRST